MSEVWLLNFLRSFGSILGIRILTAFLPCVRVRACPAWSGARAKKFDSARAQAELELAIGLVAPFLKSRDPHLAGKEKYVAGSSDTNWILMPSFVVAICPREWCWSGEGIKMCSPSSIACSLCPYATLCAPASIYIGPIAPAWSAWGSVMKHWCQRRAAIEICQPLSRYRHKISTVP
jgi:hypothetical protein